MAPPAVQDGIFLLLLLVLPLLRLSCAQDAGPGAVALEDMPPLDFRLAGIDTTEGIEQVISGKMVIQGEISVERMSLVRMIAMQALMRICENRSVPVIAEITQDIMSFGKPKPEFLIEWKLLPPIGGGHYCMESISEFGYGADEPPFNPVIGPPPIRQLLQMEFRNYRPTYTLSISKWKIFFGNHTCDFANTLAPTERASTQWTTTEPPGGTPEPPRACKDGDPLMPPWVPPDKQAAPENTAACTYATTACGCAAMRGGNCMWGPNGGGGAWCQPGDTPDGVACGACPLQAGCPLSAQEVCASVLLPCACANSAADCRWDILSTTCVPQFGGSVTTCEACSAQNFCSKPSITFTDPQPDKRFFAVMGESEVGWLINVSFDREMKLYPGALGRAQLHCRSVLETEYQVFDFPSSTIRMSNSSNLQLDVSGIPNDKTRECELVLPNDLLRDFDYVFFEGVGLGALTVIVGDTVDPLLDGFYPANSMVGITIQTTISMNFSEPVFPRNGSFVPLTALGGDWSGGRGTADVIVEKISLTGKRATFNPAKRSMTLDLSGILQAQVLYSINLQPGFLIDGAGNPFEGLPVGIYEFRTAVESLIAESPVKEKTITKPADIKNNMSDPDFWKSQMHWLVLVGLVLGCTLATTVALCRSCRAQRMMRKVHCGPLQPLENFIPEPLSGKNVIGGKAVEPFSSPRNPAMSPRTLSPSYPASPSARSAGRPSPSFGNTWPKSTSGPIVAWETVSAYSEVSPESPTLRPQPLVLPSSALASPQGPGSQLAVSGSAGASPHSGAASLQHGQPQSLRAAGTTNRGMPARSMQSSTWAPAAAAPPPRRRASALW
mmetsp:Transcript_15464/g.54182  ORF Transcript_15464/g.54182 Transcript_15464/m.54182 type:complete len:838 (+) Transcript_15464:85-2598(+)